jgi:hypothetical protein
MNLAATIWAYGTSEGVEKAWNTRGRGRKQPNPIDRNFRQEFGRFADKVGLKEVDPAAEGAGIDTQNAYIQPRAVQKWRKVFQSGGRVPPVLLAPTSARSGGRLYMVLDGHHRLAAAKSLGIKPKFISAEPKTGHHWERHVSLDTRAVWPELEKDK